MPRYSASIIFGDQLQFPAQKRASTSPKPSPASSRAALAACACNWRTGFLGVMPRSDSATPTMAALEDKLISISLVHACLFHNLVYLLVFAKATTQTDHSGRTERRGKSR